MGRISTGHPSLALPLAVAALVAALAGGALAAKGGNGGGKLTPAKVKKIADKQITKRLSSEPFHEIGASGEPGFEGGWKNYGAGGYSTAAFYKDPLGIVHLKGTIIEGANFSTAFTLPPGYRPSQHLFTAAAGDGPDPAYVVIRSNGSVEPACEPACSPSVGLDGIDFRATQ